jgi:hypothetical protein
MHPDAFYLERGLLPPSQQISLNKRCVTRRAIGVVWRASDL